MTVKFSTELHPIPSTALPPSIGGGVVLPKGLGPEALIANYSADEWELFIFEVARVWETRFHSVARMGGTGDGGLDVCGFRSEQRLAGEWVCFQCKHYSKDLERSEVLAEIAKIFNGVIEYKFTLPIEYYIVSPRGVKSSFDRKMKNPDRFKEEFLGYMRSGDKVDREFAASKDRIIELAEKTSFSIFGSMSLADLMELHQESTQHSIRFGMPLPIRPTPITPPDEIAESEANYLSKLLGAYGQELGTVLLSVADIPDGSPLASDLELQRYRFYSAESLRLFSRDKLPAHAFEQLMSEIHFGVIDSVEGASPGMPRVRAAMETAAKLSPAQSPLIAVTRIQDKQGVCHQLAAADRLSWVTPT